MAVVVAQGANAHEVVVGVGHGVPGGGGDLGEEDVVGGGGSVECAAGGTDNDFESIWVDVGAGRLRSEMKTAGAGIGDCIFRRWFGCWLGRGYGE